MDATHSADAGSQDAASGRPYVVWVRWVLLAVAAVFYALHFLHLDADFPHHSPWVDWSKYTDEGWYGDAAIRHYLTGHWYWKGDFNPAVALPVWPALEWVFFRFAGVSTYSARTLALLMFGVTLVVLYVLIERHTRQQDSRGGASLAPAMCVLMLCCSPFLYAFERLAIVEPLLIALTVLALLAASHLRPFPYISQRRLRKLKASPNVVRGVRFTGGEMGSDPVSQLRRARLLSVLASGALGLLLPAMVLTKTTALFLLPAVGYMVWARAGCRLLPALRLAALPCALGAGLWCAYFFGFVRPRYLEDYRYIFSANAYTGASTEPLASLVAKTLSSGLWMGPVLCGLVVAAVVLAGIWRRRLFVNPLFVSLLLWAAGYLGFIGYHFNLQPRYYTVVAVPLTAAVAMALDEFRRVAMGPRPLAEAIVAVCLLAVVVPDAKQQIGFARHPEYTFRAAAEGVKRVVMSEPNHSHLVLSISGSDLTLMTGLPSIDDDFGTLTLDERVKRYRPGWFAAWNELDDDKMDAISPLFTPVRVAEFPAMDDPDRNLLILYRLDPADDAPPAPPQRVHKPVPKALRTKIGQQPSVEQLGH